MPDSPRCDAVVYRRDTYRVCRRGKRKFAMHYQRGQCSRTAEEGGIFCRQHGDIAASGAGMERWTRVPVKLG